MFLSAIQTYAVLIIIAVIVLQHIFAVFCLLKLAYLDISKKSYILWNIFIIVVFFIGGTVFLIYYRKHPELRIANIQLRDGDDAAQEGGENVPASDEGSRAQSGEADVPASGEEARTHSDEAERATTDTEGD